MLMLFEPQEFEKLKKLLPLYKSALKIMLTKLEIINDDYIAFSEVNPVDHIKHRIKTPESIAQKLYNRNLPVTAESTWQYLSDIAGLRVICSFSSDIYEIAERLKQHSDITLLKESDYVSTPKDSGYRSYHMIFGVPIRMSGDKTQVKAEVQIRTAAMDFWATLEHKVKYKYSGKIPRHLSDELKICAEKTHEVDQRMFLIHDILRLINA